MIFREVGAETGTLSVVAQGAPADTTDQVRGRVAAAVRAVWDPVVAVVFGVVVVVAEGEHTA